jgi:hypothetical protein
MISRFIAFILLMTFSFTSNAEVQAGAVSKAALYKDIPLGVYLLVIGFCAFVLLRKFVSAGK